MLYSDKVVLGMLYSDKVELGCVWIQDLKFSHVTSDAN